MREQSEISFRGNCHLGRTPLHWYYSGEEPAESGRPLNRFQMKVTQHHQVGPAIDNLRNELMLFDKSEFLDGLHDIELMYRNKFAKAIARASRWKVGDFQHDEDAGWMFYPRNKFWLNGKAMRKLPVALTSGDVVSSGKNSDGSFKLHVRVPTENEQPLHSRDLVHNLYWNGAEPRKYRRVIAVMGGRINEDGTVREHVEARVRTAVDQFLKSYDNGEPAAIVFSGGKPRYEGSFEKGMTEAKAMVKKAAEVILKERPEFAKFEDPLRHIYFLEEQSKDAVGNAFFVRQLLQHPRYKKFFEDVTHVDIVIQRKYHNRFRDIFNHIFHGVPASIKMISPATVQGPEPQEESKRFDLDREAFLEKTKPGDLRSMARFLRKHHDLYKNVPISNLFLNPRPSHQLEDWWREKAWPALNRPIRLRRRKK